MAIVDERTPSHARAQALERLAETFERDRRNRGDFAQAQAAWRRHIGDLRRLLGR